MRTSSIAAAIALLLLAAPRPAAASSLFQRLDPRLASALAADAEPVPVWIDFVDKGEQGPADLQRRLAAAERALTPESRARRLRAGVSPLVDYLDLPVEPAYVAALAARGYRPYGVSRWLNGCCVRTSGAASAALGSLDFVREVSPARLARVRRPEPVTSPELRLARPIGTASAAGTPSFYGQTYWQLQRLNVPAVHDSGYIGTGVMVAMFDDGFDFYQRHEATKNIDVGDRTRDFVWGTAIQDTVTLTFGQHGEYTLSCAGGNAPGIYVGPGYGARFALARTEDDASEKPVEMVNWLMATEWADSLGADVISSSLGYLDFPDSANGAYSLTPSMLDGHTALVTRAAEIAAAKGILVVNSAGNGGPGSLTIDAPADADGDSMLAVGAVDSNGVVTSFSSRGPTADGRTKPDLCAQGSQDLLASASGTTNTYVRASGTSFSCPLTAGLVACLISARPTWSPGTLIRGLKATASRAATPDNNYGWGIPNGLAVLRWTPDTAGVPAGVHGLDFALMSSNPMRVGSGDAVVRFTLPSGSAPARVAVNAYDLGGRRVRTVWSGTLRAGLPVTARWDGADDGGRALASGLYFLAFEAPGHRATLRLALLR